MAFDIRTHLENLTVISELSSEFVCECPICNGRRLTISKATGAYSCWTSECPREEIREAVAPLGHRSSNSSQQPRKYLPALIQSPVKLARFPKPVKADLAQETWYTYSQSQKVHRYYEGEDKFTIPYFNGSRGKGTKVWFPYRIDEAELYGHGSWILACEGEKCVEFARELGIVAITWQGASWTPNDLMASLLVLRSQGISGICYYPDYDLPGYRKAVKLWQACAAPVLPKNKFPIVVLDPLEVWSDCPEGGDIADWSQQKLANVDVLESVANRSTIIEKDKFLPTK
jgi:putative DNA primase/helicase